MRLKNLIMFCSLALSFTAMAEEAAVHSSIKMNKNAAATRARATISSETAGQAALKKVHGKIISNKLENEDGSLIYAVNISTSGHKNQEVLVDAGNGKILAMNSEDGKPADKGDGDGEENDD